MILNILCFAGGSIFGIIFMCFMVTAGRADRELENEAARKFDEGGSV